MVLDALLGSRKVMLRYTKSGSVAEEIGSRPRCSPRQQSSVSPIAYAYSATCLASVSALKAEKYVCGAELFVPRGHVAKPGSRSRCRHSCVLQTVESQLRWRK